MVSNFITIYHLFKEMHYKCFLIVKVSFEGEGWRNINSKFFTQITFDLHKFWGPGAGLVRFLRDIMTHSWITIFVLTNSFTYKLNTKKWRQILETYAASVFLGLALSFQSKRHLITTYYNWFWTSNLMYNELLHYKIV